ncbi:hypothetical protein HZS_6111 [Henneguya salminicola]|uniref:Triosephosphate isomerase n=1 Tax=Henneguya salminicola TaxID=69463 RepID=A0A6G3MI52_HENSL|nr:hypothetical protein HZS_6111 [Henneguya salminicola]
MARRVFIGGNWKMQASSAKVNEIIKMLNDACFQETSRDIVVAPSYLFLSHVKSQLRKEFKVAAQNCCHKPTGAFTGEVSPQMIKDIGLEWVILGHSERRHIFKETDDIISQKIALAIESGLHVIACIGETLEQREAQQTETVLKSQLDPIASN